MTLSVPNPTYAYRIFHIDNLPVFLNNRGQYSRTRMIRKGISYRNISYGDIQDRRAGFNVPLSPYGDLHSYVPFYFTNRSPMLYACHTGTVPGYNEGQEPIIYLVTSVQNLLSKKVPFLFTDGHACMNGSNFYDNISGLSNVDWGIIDSWSWGNNQHEPYRKQRKQAELIVHKFAPLDAFIEIGVINHKMMSMVNSTLSNFNIKLPVNIRANWYY